MSSDEARPSKRSKTSHKNDGREFSISPPPRRGRPAKSDSVTILSPRVAPKRSEAIDLTEEQTIAPRGIPSPVRLTYIRDLGADQNVDAVRLKDILGDPMIRECWQFNYLFDVDWLISQFDEDTRSRVQVRIVHGSWKKEAENRIHIDDACKRHENAEAICAYMPEPFGTHHSKMMILFRHDDLAQVIIHTANMIPRDWTNMCQAAWLSPLLPLSTTSTSDSHTESISAPIGTGARFKKDILAYISSYGKIKTGDLATQLKNYDFESIRAALVASVPSRLNLRSTDPDTENLWGWAGLRHVLRQVPSTGSKNENQRAQKPSIVVQISSIATLGTTSSWLEKSLFPALSATSSTNQMKPDFSIIFPTARSIRRSLDGYVSGGSIHTKIQSAAQQKQLTYLRPLFRHWEASASERRTLTSVTSQTAFQSPTASALESNGVREAGRRNAAPHIKTYIRFTSPAMEKIDWAMVTSANLSTQAWGAAMNEAGVVRICSYEIGVVVWPDLFLPKDEADTNATTIDQATAHKRQQRIEIVPTFGNDTPSAASGGTFDEAGSNQETIRVGFRMPYDLPLVPYSAEEEPWCATKNYDEPDWMGSVWRAA